MANGDVHDQISDQYLQQFDRSIGVSGMQKLQSFTQLQKLGYAGQLGSMKSDFHGLSEFQGQMSKYSSVSHTLKIAYALIAGIIPNNPAIARKLFSSPELGTVGKDFQSIHSFGQVFALNSTDLQSPKTVQSKASVFANQSTHTSVVAGNARSTAIGGAGLVGGGSSGGSGSTTISGLLDVNISSPSDGQVLIFHAATGKWINSTSTGGGGSIALADLTDVVLTSPSSGQFLEYNGTDWVNHTLVAGDLPNIPETQVINLVADLAAKAPLASPALTGSPTAPTATLGNSTTLIATTAFVQAQIAAIVDTDAQTKTSVTHQWLASYDASTGLFTQSRPDYSDLTGTPTLAQSLANASHKWLNSYDASTGLFTQTQPDYTDLTGTPTLAQTLANASHKWLNSYNATTGLFTQTQPDYADLTGTPTLAQTKAAVASNWLRSYDATTGLFTASQPAYTDITGTPQLAVTKAAVASNWLRSYDSTTGLFTASQPAYTDLTGTPTLAQTLANTSHKWLNSYDASTGLFTQTQPAIADLSDGTSIVTAITTPGVLFTTPVVITSHTAALALINQNANLVFAGPSSGGTATPTFRSLVTADLPTTAVTAGSYVSTNLTVDVSGRITAASNGGNSSIIYAQPGDTFTTALAKVPGSGGILCIGSPLNLTANTTVPSNITLNFWGTGALVMSGFTLTINGPIIAGNTQAIFTGVSLSATVTFGTQIALAPVEWFGAVGDWNGSTGTDNTNPIQYCLNAMTAGQALLQGASYKITAALTITKSVTGIVGVAWSFADSAQFSSTAPSSTLVQTTAGANIITASGVNTSNNIGFNVFKNLRLSRSVLPTGTASGLSLSFSYAATIENIMAEDHINGFYLHGVGSAGSGYIQNCIVLWGFNGLTETTGTLTGYQVDSTDGIPSNSLRIRNVHAATNFAHNASITSSAVWLNGSHVNDFHCFHVEAAEVDYGININCTSLVFTNSSDIFISEPVLDGIWISPVKIVGVQGTVNINGGWMNINGASAVGGPHVDIQNCSHVGVTNVQFFSTASPVGPCVKASSTGNGSLRIVGNDFGANNNSAVSLTNANASIICNNVANSITATSIVSIATSPHCVIANNLLNGTATNGILIDASSTDIQGLTTNQIGYSLLGVVTNLINDSGGNTNVVTFLKGTGSGDYTGTNTSFAKVDATNLQSTITIPLGYKLIVQASCGAMVLTSAVAAAVAIFDGTTQLHQQAYQAQAVSLTQSINLLAVVVGDGASHTISLQAVTNNASDAWAIKNASNLGAKPEFPTMVLTLVRSN